MQCNSLAMSWLSSVLRHVLWSSIEHLTRRCHHPGRCDDSHCSGVEGYAPWEASLSRSNWAQSPQSGAAARQLNHRWCWDTWRSRALGCWIPSDCDIHKERSGSRNKTWHQYKGMFCGEYTFQRDQYFTLCLPKLTSDSFAHNPWVCDSHWGPCLSKLHLSGEHHLGWVCDSCWDRCLCTMHLSSEHHLGWVCGSHWGLCLFKLSLFGEHHLGWVCDSDWEWCLLWVHISGEHLLGWVCDSHWEPCLSKLHLSGEHHLGWVCGSHWGLCLFKLSLFGEHHLGWVCDSDWGGCLSKLHLAGEHHNSRVIGRECEKSIAEPFCGSHHASCIAEQETTTRAVSESTAKQWV